MNYLLVPFLAYVISDGLKFILNFFRYGFVEAIKRIGYGGFPSTHTCITTTCVFLLGWKKGFNTPEFALALGLLLIIISDACVLRMEVGKHSFCLKEIYSKNAFEIPVKLKESMGHRIFEVFGGFVLGLFLSYIFNLYI